MVVHSIEGYNSLMLHLMLSAQDAKKCSLRQVQPQMKSRQAQDK
jgi:hypothetical protein